MVDVVSGVVEDEKPSLIYRQSIWTRVTHWMWAVKRAVASSVLFRHG